MATDQGSGAAVHREYQRAFEERDRAALLEVIAEDARWHVFGDSSFAGTVEGRGEIWTRFFAPQWGTERRSEIHSVLDDGDHVVALGELAFTGAEGEVRFKTVEVYHHAHGRLTERWFFVDRRQELDQVLEAIAAEDAGSSASTPSTSR